MKKLVIFKDFNAELIYELQGEVYCNTSMNGANIEVVNDKNQRQAFIHIPNDILWQLTNISS